MAPVSHVSADFEGACYNTEAIEGRLGSRIEHHGDNYLDPRGCLCAVGGDHDFGDHAPTMPVVPR